MYFFIVHNKNELLGNYFILWELCPHLRKLLLSQLSLSERVLSQKHLSETVHGCQGTITE